MSLDLADDKSPLFEVMTWCLEAPSHYLWQSWSRSMSPYGVTMPHWIKWSVVCYEYKTENSHTYMLILRTPWPPTYPRNNTHLFAIHLLKSLELPCDYHGRHDDVIKWKHFPRYWPFVWGIHRSPVNSPHKGQWRGALMFSLICARINGWVNTRESDDLRRCWAHHDVTVMYWLLIHWPTPTNLRDLWSHVFCKDIRLLDSDSQLEKCLTRYHSPEYL